MKFLLAIIALAASTVSATDLGRRQSSLEYQVTDFTAACVPFGDICSYVFTIVDGSGPKGATNCGAIGSCPNEKSLPDVPSVKCIDNQAWDWSLQRDSQGNLDISATAQFGDGSVVQLCHQIPAKDLEMATVPGSNSNVQYESYVGPKEFKLEADDCHKLG